MSDIKQQVTVIYYSDTSLELLHEVQTFVKKANGRVVIPSAFKNGKSIVAVCEGKIEILNKIGERILPNYDVA